MDPEIKTLDNGNRLAKISIATSERWKNKEGEKVEVTDWHRIEFWGAVVDVIEKYLNKGDKVYVEGKIKQDSWEDDSGNKKYRTYILGDQLKFMSTKNNGSSSHPEPPEVSKKPNKSTTKKAEADIVSDTDDDLPF